MYKEFCNYTQSLALKELGFDEPCFAWYVSKDYGLEIGKVIQTDLIKDAVVAPTFHQAFKFFREKYNLDGSMSVDVWNKKTTSYRIIGGIEGIVEADSYGSLYDMDSIDYDSYEEAEQECLNKLIEIVKDK